MRIFAALLCFSFRFKRLRLEQRTSTKMVSGFFVCLYMANTYILQTIPV